MQLHCRRSSRMSELPIYHLLQMCSCHWYDLRWWDLWREVHFHTWQDSQTLQRNALSAWVQMPKSGPRLHQDPEIRLTWPSSAEKLRCSTTALPKPLLEDTKVSCVIASKASWRRLSEGMPSLSWVQANKIQNGNRRAFGNLVWQSPRKVRKMQPDWLESGFQKWKARVHCPQEWRTSIWHGSSKEWGETARSRATAKRLRWFCTPKAWWRWRHVWYINK